MPCFTAPLTNQRQLIIKVWVTNSTLDFEGGAFHPEKHPNNFCGALLDTGANISCVTENLAREMGLSIHEKRPFVSASDMAEANVYRVNIHIPAGGSILQKGDEIVRQVNVGNCLGMTVFGIKGMGQNFDVLLGLDFISQGALHVSDGHFTLCI